jgi:arginine decarboxylase
LGCVVETTGINKNSDEIIDEAKEMVKYMMNKRQVEIKDLIIEYSTTKVKNIASSISAVVYLNDDIVEE